MNTASSIHFRYNEWVFFFECFTLLKVGFFDLQVKNTLQCPVRQGNDFISHYLPHGERGNIIVLKVAEVFSCHAVIVVAQERGLSNRRVYGKGETCA